MKRTFFRFVLCFAAAALVAPVMSRSQARAADAPNRKILFFTKSSGFEHSVISWKKGKPSFAEKVLLELGKKNNWEFTFSKDGSLFTPQYLAQFDAYFFYTTGDLCSPGTDKEPPMTPAGKQALFDAIKGGKGFIGTHAAADTFHTGNEAKKGADRYKNHGAEADPYVRMLGGEFIKHDSQQKATVHCVDPKFPGLEKHADGLSFAEEWYSLKDFGDDLHVLLVQETNGMTGPDYQRPPYPETWIHKYGEGRVFYTSMGHREDVWTNPAFQDVLTGGIRWACGDATADVTPNLSTAAPGAMQNPGFSESKDKPAEKKPKAKKPKKAATN
jgi:type 1 glutamine amidotransferase